MPVHSLLSHVQKIMSATDTPPCHDGKVIQHFLSSSSSACLSSNLPNVTIFSRFPPPLSLSLMPCPLMWIVFRSCGVTSPLCELVSLEKSPLRLSFVRSYNKPYLCILQHKSSLTYYLSLPDTNIYLTVTVSWREGDS